MLSTFVSSRKMVLDYAFFSIFYSSPPQYLLNKTATTAVALHHRSPPRFSTTIALFSLPSGPPRIFTTTTTGPTTDLKFYWFFSLPHLQYMFSYYSDFFPKIQIFRDFRNRIIISHSKIFSIGFGIRIWIPKKFGIFWKRVDPIRSVISRPNSKW